MNFLKKIFSLKNSEKIVWIKMVYYIAQTDFKHIIINNYDVLITAESLFSSWGLISWFWPYGVILHVFYMFNLRIWYTHQLNAFCSLIAVVQVVLKYDTCVGVKLQVWRFLEVLVILVKFIWNTFNLNAFCSLSALVVVLLYDTSAGWNYMLID